MWALGEKHAQETADGDNFTFLAKGVDFKGVVNFDGTIRIDGRVEGEVHTTGTLIVGEQATVKGMISVGTLMTSGKINGTVTATAKIHIQKHGVLIGDIRTPNISIEEGGHLHGMCDMGAHKWVDEEPAAYTHTYDLSGRSGKIRASDL
jgi:cytoskeletal protein CcmA (bactofilin family)